MEPFIGQIMLFAGNFAPRGWALCDGTLLDIQANSALFSILGTTYGGNGTTTFALPDLRGRAALHVGDASDLNAVTLGQKVEPQKFTKARGDASTLPGLGLNYCIALSGLYPSRS